MESGVTDHHNAPLEIDQISDDIVEEEDHLTFPYENQGVIHQFFDYFVKEEEENSNFPNASRDAKKFEMYPNNSTRVGNRGVCHGEQYARHFHIKENAKGSINRGLSAEPKSFGSDCRPKVPRQSMTASGQEFKPDQLTQPRADSRYYKNIPRGPENPERVDSYRGITRESSRYRVGIGNRVYTQDIPVASEQYVNRSVEGKNAIEEYTYEENVEDHSYMYDNSHLEDNTYMDAYTNTHIGTANKNVQDTTDRWRYGFRNTHCCERENGCTNSAEEPSTTCRVCRVNKESRPRSRPCEQVPKDPRRRGPQESRSSKPKQRVPFLSDEEFLKKFPFKDCDLTKDELEVLKRKLCENKVCYSQNKYDIGTSDYEFHIKLTENAELKKQRPSKVPVQYEDKLYQLLIDLEDAGIIQQMGLDNPRELGTEFINPIIILPKGDSLKIVLDARYLNSITDSSQYTWPLEPLHILLNKIKGKYFTTMDLSYAYSQIRLSEATRKLCSFVVTNTQYLFNRGFYGLKSLPAFFSRIMSIIFSPLIKAAKVLTYLDDVLAQAFTKKEMFEIIDKIHEVLRNANMKAAPEKTYFFQRKVKYLGHMISEDGLSPIQSRVEALKKLQAPKNANGILRFLGCFNFYSRYIKNLHVDCKIMYDLCKKDTEWKWTEEHQKLFETIKDSIKEDALCAIPDPKYPFIIYSDASNVGVGCVLLQERPEGRRIVSFNSRVFNENEQKMPIIYKELAAAFFALETYEYIIIGSPFKIHLYCDHRPILYLWEKKGQLNHKLFRYQLQFTKFPHLEVHWTQGNNLSFADILSRDFTPHQLIHEQIKHKILPKELSFMDCLGGKVYYSIEHDKNILQKTDNPYDSFPIIAEIGERKFRFQFFGKEARMESKEIFDVRPSKLISFNYLVYSHVKVP